MNEATIILAVVHDDRLTAHPRGGMAILFEVAEGPHERVRGADWQLFDLVGPIRWDESQVVSYETGQRRPVERSEE